MRFGRQERGAPRNNENHETDPVEAAAELVRNTYPDLIEQFVANMEPVSTTKDEETGEYFRYKTHGVVFPDSGNREVNDAVVYVAIRVVRDELVGMIASPQQEDIYTGQNLLNVPDEYFVVLNNSSPWCPPKTDEKPKLMYEAAIIRNAKPVEKTEPKKKM